MTTPSTPHLGALHTVPALDRRDLLAPSVADALASYPRSAQIGVVEIDPDLADTATLSETYGLGLDTAANCVLVAGKRDGEERVAACVVRADTRADINTVVKALLDVRKCSFLSMQRAVEESGMEYGGITPLGLPAAWRVLVDDRVAAMGTAVIGSGLRRSKILIPGDVLAGVAGFEVVTGLAG